MEPLMYAAILQELERLGSPMPCFARVEGSLCLLPEKTRPPYDADLHDLMRRVLRTAGEKVALDQAVRVIPALWRRLPKSARMHCAQSPDDVWPTAFAACLLTGDGQAAEAKRYLNACSVPLRGYMPKSFAARVDNSCPMATMSI